MLLDLLYQLNIDAVLSHCAPDVTFLSSVRDSVSVGIDEMRRLLLDRCRHFNIAHLISHDILRATLLGNGESACIVIDFITATDPSSGVVEAHHRLATLIWNLQGEQPQLMHLHLSAPLAFRKRTQDPNAMTPETSAYVKALLERLISRSIVTLRDVSGCVYYVSSAEVRYVEARKQRTVVHCLNNDVVVRRGFADVVSDFGQDLTVVHRSFAVSPMYVRSIRTDSVVLDDGSVIPVPQRRLTKVREDLHREITRLASIYTLDETPLYLTGADRQR